VKSQEKTFFAIVQEWMLKSYCLTVDASLQAEALFALDAFLTVIESTSS
jgi:hypothetical protein